MSNIISEQPARVFNHLSIGAIDNKCQSNLEILSSNDKTGCKEQHSQTIHSALCMVTSIGDD